MGGDTPPQTALLPGDEGRSGVRRGGRPTREQATRLNQTILDAAASLFLADGYGSTSIEAVAGKAGISKRTLYSRYPDKAALFGAVIESVIGGLRPAASVPLIAGDSLRETLQRLAGFILHAAVTPAAIALHRLIVAESARFPELAAAVAKQGATQQAVDLIASLLDAEARAGRAMWPDTRFAAEHFLYMVFVLPQRRAMGLGEPMTEAELDIWARDTVALFLNGCMTAAPDKN